MHKLDWLTEICKGNHGKTPNTPFAAFDETYVLYSTNRQCVVRVPCSKEEAVRFTLDDKYVQGFFEVMETIFKSTYFKGKIDALLLKDMTTAEPHNYIKVDGSFFSRKLLALALAGWDSTDAVLARASGPLTMRKPNEEALAVSKKTPELHPLLLHSQRALVLVAPAYDVEEGGEEFPSSAISYT